jgi:hypothetical protein
MLGYDYERGLESVVALGITFENIFFQELTSSESMANVHNNICSVMKVDEETNEREVIRLRGSGSSGLMITTDGFIITTYHTIMEWLNEWRTVNEEENSPIFWRLANKYKVIFPVNESGQQKMFALDPTIYGYYENNDLALVKAIIPDVKPLPVKFRTVEVRVGLDVAFRGLIDGVVCNQYGKIVEMNRYMRGGCPDARYDTFLTDARAAIGYSGGFFIDEDNSGLVGMATYELCEGLTPAGRWNIGGISVYQIRDFVRVNQVRLARMLFRV